MTSLWKKSLWPIGVVILLAVGLYAFNNTPQSNQAVAQKRAVRKNQEAEAKIEALGISINGEVQAIVKDQAAAEEVLTTVKAQLGNNQTPSAGLKVEETISLSALQTDASAVLTRDEAVKMLITGDKQSKEYKVKTGDSLWSIAKANGLTLEELQQANPQIQGDKLALDDTVWITKQEPLIHILSTEEKKVLAEIPFQLQTSFSSKIPKGQVKVVQAGKPGKKEEVYLISKRNSQVTEKKLLSSTVIAQPVPKVVVNGSGVVQKTAKSKTVQLASRSGGSGRLAWPLQGRITSGFGWRQNPFGKGRDFHRGIDIDGETGDPIAASEDGVVTFAGRRGSYGLQVEIDHGNGLVTRYSHASKLKVEVGDKVSRGQTIALVGSTGRSTGSHVDLEVLVDGEPQNPLSFLR